MTRFMTASITAGDAARELPAELRKTCRLQRHRYEDIWRELVVDASKAGYVPEGVNLDAARLMLLGAVNWAGEWYARIAYPSTGFRPALPS
jgi:hypothetical protein